MNFIFPKLMQKSLKSRTFSKWTAQKSILTALSAIQKLYCTGLQFKMICFRIFADFSFSFLEISLNKIMYVINIGILRAKVFIVLFDFHVCFRSKWKLFHPSLRSGWKSFHFDLKQTYENQKSLLKTLLHFKIPILIT